MPRFKILLILPTLLVGLTAPIVEAQSGSGTGSTNAATRLMVERWYEKLIEIDDLISNGESERALRQADRLALRMVDKIHSGAAMGELLGLVTALRALAAYNTGQESLAIWHWHIALQFFPDVEKRDLSKYGEAARFLRDHPPRSRKQALDDLPENVLDDLSENVLVNLPKKALDDLPEKAENDIVPPEVIRRRGVPRYPRAKMADMRALAVTLQVVIDREGIPTSPVILEAKGEFTLVCAAFEMIRQWKFKPATVNGEPIEDTYTLTMGFY